MQRLASNGEYGGDGQPQPIDPPTMARILASAYEADTIVAILTHLKNMATDIQKQYHQAILPYTAKLSKGFSLLPDELIGAIFKIAVRIEGHNGGRQARWLGQVSRRLRKIALGDREMWTTFYSNSHRKDLEMAIKNYTCTLCLDAKVSKREELLRYSEKCSPEDYHPFAVA